MPSSYAVLIVGELGPFRGVLVRWFAEWGYESRFASTPGEAHQLCAAWRPDLVLVDHLRSPSDFPTWWYELRSHPVIADTPTIVTGDHPSGPIQSEAAAILRRPYTRSELEAVLHRVRGNLN